MQFWSETNEQEIESGSDPATDSSELAMAMPVDIRFPFSVCSVDFSPYLRAVACDS